MTKKNEALIEKIEQLAFIIAAVDGISEEEGQEFEMLAGKMRLYLDFKPAVEEFIKTKDLDKAKSKIKGPPVHQHIMKMGFHPHIDEIAKKIQKIIDKGEDVIEEYDALLKVTAADIDNEFDRQIALIAAEDLVRVDGADEYEMRSLMVLRKFWSISTRQTNTYFSDYIKPLWEIANDMPFKD